MQSTPAAQSAASFMRLYKLGPLDWSWQGDSLTDTGRAQGAELPSAHHPPLDLDLSCVLAPPICLWSAALRAVELAANVLDPVSLLPQAPRSVTHPLHWTPHCAHVSQGLLRPLLHEAMGPSCRRVLIVCHCALLVLNHAQLRTNAPCMKGTAFLSWPRPPLVPAGDGVGGRGMLDTERDCIPGDIPEKCDRHMRWSACTLRKCQADQRGGFPQTPAARTRGQACICGPHRRSSGTTWERANGSQGAGTPRTQRGAVSSAG